MQDFNSALSQVPGVKASHIFWHKKLISPVTSQWEFGGDTISIGEGYVTQAPFPHNLFLGMREKLSEETALPHVRELEPGWTYIIRDRVLCEMITGSFVLEHSLGKEEYQFAIPTLQARYELAAHLGDLTREYSFYLDGGNTELSWSPSSRSYEIEIQAKEDMSHFRSFTETASQLLQDFLHKVVQEAQL